MILPFHATGAATMIQWIVIGIILVMFAINLGVSLLNYRQRRQPIPAIVEGVYDQQTYARWLNYSMETLRFQLITRAIDMLLTLVLLLSGAFGWLERLVNTWFAADLLRTLAFFGCICPVFQPGGQPATGILRHLCN
jgi:STE24 endopeptidase